MINLKPTLALATACMFVLIQLAAKTENPISEANIMFQYSEEKEISSQNIVVGFNPEGAHVPFDDEKEIYFVQIEDFEDCEIFEIPEQRLKLTDIEYSIKSIRI